MKFYATFNCLSNEAKRYVETFFNWLFQPPVIQGVPFEIFFSKVNGCSTEMMHYQPFGD